MIRPTAIALTILCGALHAASINAQGGNPAGMSPDTPGMDSASPPPDHSNVQDKLFVRQAALGGQAEVELGKLAQRKASSAPVREFAGHMVEAHTKLNQQLQKLGRGVNADAPKADAQKSTDPEHVRIRTELDKSSGKDFDVAYVTSQIQDHQRTANLLQWHLSTGQNEALKKYSADTLPEVMSHLEMAQQQLAMLTSGGRKMTP
jgi:putative membrane protein